MRHEQRMVSGNKADKTGVMPKIEKDISMSNFQIKIAGLVIGINNKYKYVSRLCEEYKVVPGIDMEKEVFSVSASEEEILKEQAGNTWFSLPYCESLCLYRAICLKLIGYDAFLMHSAAVSLDGEAYIFAAKSGVGKTTQVKLWMEEFGERVQVVNGDKPIYRFLNGVLYVCGSPWQGKEGLGNNIMVPVKTIFFLERSEENRIRPMTENEVIGRIFHQMLMPREEEAMEHFMDMVEKTMAVADCYLLQCNMQKDAVRVAYEGCRENRL